MELPLLLRLPTRPQPPPSPPPPTHPQPPTPRDGFSPLKLVLNWSFKPVLSVFSLKKLNRFKPVYKIIKNFFIDYPIKMYKQPDWLNVGSFFFNFSIENE